MGKTAKEKDLEKQYAEAKANQTGEIAQAQIEVYEGQTYEAKDAYQEAKAKRSTARSKLPKDIPDDKYYKEKLLEAQYIKARVSSPEQREQVDDYTTEIKKQQKAHATVQVLDKAIPALYASAVEESNKIETKVEKAKVEATKKQEKLITGFQTAITTEQKSESAKIKKINDATIALETKKVSESKALADSRQATFDTWWDSTPIKGKNKMKQYKYAQFRDLPFEHGEIIPRDTGRASRWQPSWDISASYYQRASEKFGITPQQAKDASQKGMQNLSGSSRQDSLRRFQDANDGGNRVDMYAQNRALAKKVTASAYASMSAVERSTSSALASEFATNPDAKKKNTLGVLHETTGGLLGKSIKDTGVAKGEPSTFKVYETNKKLYKSSNGLLGKEDVTTKVMPIIEKQRETELANRRQQQYVEELRAGNIGIATALTNPQTTQNYQGTSTVNLKSYLEDRKIVAHTTSDSLFSADADKSKMGVKVTGKEATERKHAKERIDVFKPIVYNTQKVKDSTAVRFTHLPDPTVGTIGMEKTNDVLEQKGQSYFGLTIPQIAQDKAYDYTVYDHAPASFTTSSGSLEYQKVTPVTFDTKKEADDYNKARPKVFSGTDNDLWNNFQYASAVDSGEVIHPRETPTLTDDVRYYANVMNRPLVNLGASVVNLTQDKQVPIYQTGSERLIGGTINDVVEGQPLKGTGVTGTYNYVKQDPLRTVLELPAEALMWVAGGKAFQLGVRGASVVKGGLAVSKVIPQPLKTVGTKIESGYNTVTSIPSKIGSSVYTYGTVPRGYGAGGYKVFRSELGDKQFTTGQQIVRQGIVTPYNIIRTGKEKILQYNPLTRWEYSQTKKIGSSVYPDEVPRRIEKIGSTYVITAGTENFPQSVSAITVKFGKGGKTSYYTDSPNLGVAGSKGLVVVGDLPKGIAESTKTGNYLFEVPVKGDRVILKDPMKLKGNEGKTGKEYVTPIESFTKQDVGQQVGFKVSEKTGVARQSDEPPFYRGYTKETIIETNVLRTTPKKVRYDMDGKIIKDKPVNKKSTILKDLADEPNITGKTGTGKKSDTIELPPSKEGLQSQTKLKPKTDKERSSSLSELARQEAKASVKISPYSSAIVGTATKASAVIGIKTLTSTRVDTGVILQQKIKTGLVQESALKTEQQLKTPQRLKTGMRMETGLKLDTGLKTQQKTATMLTLPTIIPTRSQTPKIIAFVLPKVEEKVSTRKGKRGKKAGFIGNVRLDNIMGMYKRKEITYGARKVTKLERQDMRLTAKTPNRIAMPASSLLKTKKKKKKKIEMMFGNKSKDEFGGFGLSKPKKTKRKKRKKTTKTKRIL